MVGMEGRVSSRRQVLFQANARSFATRALPQTASCDVESMG